ncbi:hypothetical protein chiPu_0022869 [Chiloscyllium punctatum]|uniref:Uncharacterized protein n=1 Tax=Chiloscyllium punctatum TaxID=137246 RepID=A0A401T9U4_CHIPU|nr:hypothetical protein [Chiloscyllium punctatum]
MESAIKCIMRKFPAIDIRSNNNQLSSIQKDKSDILKNLTNFYHSFVDVLEFRVSPHPGLSFTLLTGW